MHKQTEPEETGEGFSKRLMEEARVATEPVECHECYHENPRNEMKEIDGELYCPKCVPLVRKKMSECKACHAQKPRFQMREVDGSLYCKECARLVHEKHEASLGSDAIERLFSAYSRLKEDCKRENFNLGQLSPSQLADRIKQLSQCSRSTAYRCASAIKRARSLFMETGAVKPSVPTRFGGVLKSNAGPICLSEQCLDWLNKEKEKRRYSSVSVVIEQIIQEKISG